MSETNTTLLGPRASGLCRSLNSWWGEDWLIIYAHYGLTEWVTRGTVVPDAHIVDRETLRPVVEFLGSKSTQLVARTDGNAEVRVPERERKRFCLSPLDVAEIAKLAKAMEVERGTPVDVRWTYDGETLRLREW